MQRVKEYREVCNACGYSRTLTEDEYEKLSELNKDSDSLCPACGAGNRNGSRSIEWRATENWNNFRNSPV